MQLYERPLVQYCAQHAIGPSYQRSNGYRRRPLKLTTCPSLFVSILTHDVELNHPHSVRYLVYIQLEVLHCKHVLQTVPITTLTDTTTYYRPWPYTTTATATARQPTTLLSARAPAYPGSAGAVAVKQCARQHTPLPNTEQQGPKKSTQGGTSEWEHEGEE